MTPTEMHSIPLKFFFFNPLWKHWVEIVTWKVKHCSCVNHCQLIIMLLMFLLADADTDPYAFVYAAIIIPLMCAGLAALTFVCYRKYVTSFCIDFSCHLVCIWYLTLALYRNKDNILPKIPKPRDLLSDISDNNNKVTVFFLFLFLLILALLCDCPAFLNY